MLTQINNQKFKNLSDIENWINSFFNPSENVLNQTKEILQSLNSNEQIISILKSLLLDKKKLEEIASRSYLHYNGFDKIVLLENKELGYRLRLHLWRPENHINYFEHIHNHPWDFSSIILAGALKFQIYSPDCMDISQKDYYKYLTLPSKEKGQGHILKPNGKSKLKLVLDASLNAGSFYSNAKEIIHRVIKDNNQFCATLILQAPINSVKSDIFTEESYTDDCMSVNHTFYDYNFLEYLFNCLIDELK